MKNRIDVFGILFLIAFLSCTREAKIKGGSYLAFTGGNIFRQTVSTKRAVKIARLEPVGNYAVRIVFDDGHDTGLYSWAYLRELGEEHDEKWPANLEDLAAQGLAR